MILFMKTITALHRVLEPILRSLPPEAARQIARARADDELQQRVEELAWKANEGTLSPEERSEYEAYVDAGDIVATLQAVARKTLQTVAG
jgi:CBS domain containing-hemolysin-like protein